MQIASSRKRLAAFAINAVIAVAVYYAFRVLGIDGLRWLFGLLLAGWLLYALFPVIMGGTPGDLVMKLRLVNAANGEKIGIVRATMRSFFALFSIGLCCMGFALMLILRNHQSLHDVFTNTVAMETKTTAVSQ